MPAVIARRLVVRGCVQGVGFRQATMAAAASCGIDGWVRNRVDGSVEAYVQGDAEAVARVIAWCRRGPPAARVAAVDVTELPPAEDFRGFRLLPTQ
jgi:acylphosphatase